MTMRPEMRFRCDRCPAEEVADIQSTGINTRFDPPEGWLLFRLGGDPATPPQHFCPTCSASFQRFVEDE